MRRAILLPTLLILTLPGIASAVDSQSPQPPSSAEQREQRGDQLLSLKEHVEALASDDANAREQAQDALIELGASFRDEIDSALASTQNLEIRTRLKEILEAWARQEALDMLLASAQIARAQETTTPPQTYARAPERSRYIHAGDGEHRQTLGYALSAIPQSYDGTGRSSFQINNTGTVYQRDSSDQDVQHLTNYQPDAIWVIAE